jgi:predicted ArsR family transcriptional regulator
MRIVPLWRVCRVLANRLRLRTLLLLKRRQSLRVGEIARAMKISGPTASQYMRALEACGFVRARRVRRAVIYALAWSNKGAFETALLDPLMGELAAGKKSIEAVFKFATAFTNAGRIEAFRSLKERPKSLIELKSELEWSRWTVRRHLEKLKRRGFVQQRQEDGIYECATVGNEFGQALARVAGGKG